MPSLSVLQILSVLAWLPMTPFGRASVAPNACPSSQVAVRLPPYLDLALNSSSSGVATSGGDHDLSSSKSSSFLAPPLGFYQATWYLTNVSNAAYRMKSNMQWDPMPVQASCEQNTTAACSPGTLSGELTDLSTWVIQNNSDSNPSAGAFNYGALGGGGRPVASTFGYDTPRRLANPALGPDWDGVFDVNVYAGDYPGGTFTEPWAVLYWGIDANQIPFMMVHEGMGTVGSGARTPPCLSLFTQSTTGPHADSLADVMQALTELNNQDMTDMVHEIGPVNWDYNLPGGAAICGKGCQANKVQ